MMKNTSGRRRRQPPTIEELRASFDEIMDQVQDYWQEEVLSDAPCWGLVLGLHLRLCELEHLQEAGLELLQ